MVLTTSLPSPVAQAERLIELGLLRIADVAAARLRRIADGAPPDALLAIDPDRLPPSTTAPLLRRDGKAGFVVTDMTDVDAFAPIADARPPADVYLVRGIERGDELANASPNEALPAILDAGRTPLLLSEGILWLLQQPDALERNHCFMTVGSRLRKDAGRLDPRTPAIWISNGVGRDGRANRGAPKVGWCWAGNRHTWLGFASAAAREPIID